MLRACGWDAKGLVEGGRGFGKGGADLPSFQLRKVLHDQDVGASDSEPDARARDQVGLDPRHAA